VDAGQQIIEPRSEAERRRRKRKRELER
jgi:hypothetical protein